MTTPALVAQNMHFCGDVLPIGSWVTNLESVLDKELAMSLPELCLKANRSLRSSKSSEARIISPDLPSAPPKLLALQRGVLVRSAALRHEAVGYGMRHLRSHCALSGHHPVSMVGKKQPLDWARRALCVILRRKD